MPGLQTMYTEQTRISFPNRTRDGAIPKRNRREDVRKTATALTGKTTHTEEQCLHFSLLLKNGGEDILSPNDCAGDY